MSKQIVIEYINSNERKHLAENCDEYNKLEDWIDYAKTHIYYHLVVCLESEEIANEEIEEIWNEHHDEEVDLEEEERHFGCDKCEYYFNEGKDHCKSCGFDLNIFNKPEEEVNDN